MVKKKATELGKWPRLLVVGDPITKEQAEEVIIRTTDWWLLQSNDRDFIKSIKKIVGIREEKPGIEEYEKYSASVKEVIRKTRGLNLEFLHNDRICSSWIGGPHGWCDWDGTIGCSNYNIGKWPSIEAIRRDLQEIAEAFPFLKMKVQLLSESHRIGDQASISWNVSNGKLSSGPKKIITYPSEPMVMAVLVPGGEIGVKIDEFREIFNRIVNNA